MTTIAAARPACPSNRSQPPTYSERASAAQQRNTAAGEGEQRKPACIVRAAGMCWNVTTGMSGGVKRKPV